MARLMGSVMGAPMEALMDRQTGPMMGLYSDHEMVNSKDGLKERLRERHSALPMVIQKVVGTAHLKEHSKALPKG